MNQIKKFLHLLDENVSLELYMNNIHDAVLVIVYPSSIEHHIDIDMRTVPVNDIIIMQELGVIYIPYDDAHSEPQVDIACPYLNTNLSDSFDEYDTEFAY